jgi:hypothetical protein
MVIAQCQERDAEMAALVARLLHNFLRSVAGLGLPP